MKLLALDIEGTIITEYDYSKEENGRFPAIIDTALKNLLKRFYDADIKIVLATGTDGADLAYYRSQFQKAGIDQYITAYSPAKHASSDGKEDKLLKYSTQYNINASDIVFFDDGESNVSRAKSAGFINSFPVNTHNPLVQQLKSLADRELVANNRTTAAPSIVQNITLMGTGNDYQQLPLEFRQFLSAYSQKKRHAMNHISTEQFWLSLTNEQKKSCRIAWEVTENQEETPRYHADLSNH